MQDKNIDLMAHRKTPIEKIPGYEMTDRGPIIFGPEDKPLEAPVQNIEQGPLYMDVAERLPDVGSEVSEPESQQAAFSLGRRELLKVFGATAAVASASCVRRPLEMAVPYVNQPVDQAVGVPTNYATTCGECAAGCGVVVKTSSGLPIKIEGNPEHPVSQGGTCAVGQATLQGLFHPERRKKPFVQKGSLKDEVSWDEACEMLGSGVVNKKVAIFTGGSTGHQREFYSDVLKKLGGSADDLYTYEPNGLYSAVVQAHKIAYGMECSPRLEMRQAKLVVGIGSDFLDLGTSNVFFAKSFAGIRNVREGSMGKLIQLESNLTQTGGRADERFVIAPGSEVVAAMALLKALLEHGNVKGSREAVAQAQKVVNNHSSILASATETTSVDKAAYDSVAKQLLSESSVVLAGSSATDVNATALQLVTILINELIGAYNKTLLLNRGWMQSPIRPGDMKRFMANVGKYDVVFFVDTNPLFTLPKSWGFEETLKKIPVVVSMQPFPCEMDVNANFVLNTNHYLESWGDEQPVAGFWSPRQPAVRMTTESRQAEDAFLWILAYAKKPMGYKEYREYLLDKWRAVHKQVDAKVEFDIFFDAVLRRGFVGRLETRNSPNMGDVASKVSLDTASFARSLKLVAPMDPRLRDGRGAHKPLLQEIGDGITTIAWDTWIAIHPKTAQDMGFKRNDVIVVEGPGGSFEAALYPQPGTHADAIVVHRGNGHTDPNISLVSAGVGANPTVVLARAEDRFTGECAYSASTVTMKKTGRIYMLAAMQKTGDLGNRTDIVRKLSVEEAAHMKPRTKSLDEVPNLYPVLDEGVPYRWGMSVDLTKCTGCGSCMAACAVENNVPQTGREGILKHRMMHWIRLDRYYQGELDNPQVTIQPMMCQQCTHAPCEAVCPVIATSHDPEGINAMTYNRCIGTRYCANACPYKVRRFNWWTHKWGEIGERPQDRNPRALNPDVTVRTRGVMEKCNFCAHRVRAAKFKAKDRGGLIQDGELRTACEQACPSDALVFGNLKDPQSRAARLRQDPRAYLALGGDPEEGEYGLKTLPNVSYLMQVSFREGAKEHGEEHHAENTKSGSEKKI